MTIFGRPFSPPWWSILVTLLGVSLFVTLGLWQLSRAELKSGIMELYQQRLSEEYLQPGPLDFASSDLQYLRVELAGEYDLSRQLLVDNRLHNGRAGYHVLTPWVMANGAGILLVNRGWVAQGATRAELPQLEVPVLESAIRGILVRPDNSGFRLGEVNLGVEWPQVIPFIDMDALQAQFPGPLLPVILWLAPESQGAYVREWIPVWADPEKSRAYAVQWFSFAAIAVLLFFGLNLRKSHE